MLKVGAFRRDGGKLALTAVALQDHISRSVPSLQRPSVSHATRPRPTRPRREDGETGEEQEYVLDPGPPPLTLAQKLGLVAAPRRRLTADEWTEAKSRSIQEGDSAQPCAICADDFRLQPQVLLSCSHVFHKVCVRSLERFSGRKCCPLCRAEPYEARVIHDGARLHREKCAVRIQARWRGHAVRKWYRGVTKRVPPKDPRLRRRFFEEKFSELNERLVQSCSTDVDSFLRQIDLSVASSRSAVSHVHDQHTTVRVSGEEEWTQVQEKAERRGVHDCPICLTPLSSSSKPLLLLSCSHLFHQSCLRAFESFCQEGGATCPLCRRLYRAVPARLHSYDDRRPTSHSQNINK
ncbi:RING finger protein 32 isoform X2 [Trichomycterus rosablanca]|uniref:RING finger protein 32 isoform X2 n=1 Tax=Trichomycterus rosablanca TaxID=2290929 RepID=UPI002F35EFFC